MCEGFRQERIEAGGARSRRPCRRPPCARSSDRLERLAVLDIVPTRTVFRATDKGIATAYYHWFFLVQPERLIGHDPVYYLHRALGAWSRGGLQSFASEALAEYERCFRDPDVIHASCEDYRAGADDRSGVRRGLTQRTIACPLLVLWGRHGLMERHFDVLDAWCERAGGPVSGRAIDCGHFLAEERPEETADELIAFFSG